MLRQVAANNGILVAQYALASLTPLLLIPHIVRTIGVEAYGEIAVAVAWATLASVVVQYAFQLTGPQRVAQRGEGKPHGSIFLEISVAKVLLLVLMLPALGGLALFSLPQAAGAYIFVLFALPVAAALNSSWYLLALDRVLLLSGMVVCGSAIALVIGFSFVTDASASSVWSAVGALVAAPVVAGVATLLAASQLANRAGLRWSDARPLRALNEGLTLFASQFAAAMYSTIGPIVVSQFATVAEAGVYSTVERIINALLGACLLTHTAAFPRLAAAYYEDRTAYWRLLKYVTGAYGAAAACMSLAVWIFHDAILHLVFGSSTDNASLLAWGLIWLVVGILGPALTAYLTVCGRGREVMPLTLKVLGLSTVLGIPGVLLFGGAGWMAALVMSQVLVANAAYKNWRMEHAN